MVISLFAVGGCLESYYPPATNERVGYLVVDGYLNTTKSVATVKLSRTLGISIAESFPEESNAKVSIESDQGDIYPLNEMGNGIYSQTGINAQDGKSYQLHIKTSDGNEYLSKNIQFKSSPSLDSIIWKPDADGITLHVNAHDDTNKTHYYKWNFVETWQYTSTFFSYFKFVDGVPTPRTPADYIFNCWKTAHEDQVLITSTVPLNADVVHDFPLVTIPRGSIKLSHRYSILVEQRALDDDAYNYWSLLKKTTENLGGLFDPLPSQVTGNVYNINNSNEPVLGYFGGGNAQEKRIFILFSDLPDHLQTYSTGLYCTQGLVPVGKLSANGGQVLINAVGTPVPTDFFVSTPDCSDCRVNGGSTIKPDFWP